MDETNDDEHNTHYLSHVWQLEDHSDFACDIFTHLDMLLEPQNRHELLLDFLVDGDGLDGLDENVDLEAGGDFKWNRGFL